MSCFKVGFCGCMIVGLFSLISGYPEEGTAICVVSLILCFSKLFDTKVVKK